MIVMQVTQPSILPPLSALLAQKAKSADSIGVSLADADAIRSIQHEASLNACDLAELLSKFCAYYSRTDNLVVDLFTGRVTHSGRASGHWIFANPFDPTSNMFAVCYVFCQCLINPANTCAVANSVRTA